MHVIGGLPLNRQASCPRAKDQYQMRARAANRGVLHLCYLQDL